MLVLADRVQETSTTAGTGTLSLAGAVAGYRTFVSGIGTGNTTYYTIFDSTANVWEVGLGTVTSGAPSTLSRTTVLSNSSGTTSPLTLAGNSVNVWCDYPAAKAIYYDASGNVTLGAALNVTGTTTLATSLTGLLKTTTGVVSAATSGTDYAAPISFGTTPPGSPVAGLLWWDTTYGTLKIYYTDATGSQWVDASAGSIGPQGPAGPAGGVTSVGGTGTVSGISLSGTVTSTGNLTLGGTLDLSAPPAIGGTTPAAITGTTIASATAPTNTVPALSLTGTPNAAAGAKTGVLGIGSNFTATDKNIMASMVQNINDYTQVVIQNPNSGTTASADFIVNNDNTTGSGTFGDFGINSSTFSGTGSFSSPNATYLYSNGGDLVIGTQSANVVKFPIGSSTASDAATITSTGLNSTVIGATTPAAITGTNIIATAGLYAQTTFGGTYTDGLVLDYLTGNGRISVGTADTITFYTGGVANTAVGLIPTMAMNGIIPMENWVRLTATYTLTSQTAAQKLFNASTNGAVTLPIGTYSFECFYSLSSMSATSGSFGFALVAGTAVIGAQGWWAMAEKGTATLSTATTAQSTYSTAANTTLATASTNTVGYAYIRGTFTITTAGTLIPSVSLGVASAAIVGIGSFFRCSPVSSSATATTVGNWS